jgi:hypothetical protein
MAAPPPGVDTDSVIAHWVHQLYTPEGTLCCGVSDCRPTAFRIVDEQPVVWIGKDEYGETAPDQWVPVPDDLIENTRAPGPPPDGRVWACWYNSKLRCIVLGSGS